MISENYEALAFLQGDSYHDSTNPERLYQKQEKKQKLPPRKF
jgi:hypothetical protein